MGFSSETFVNESSEYDFGMRRKLIWTLAVVVVLLAVQQPQAEVAAAMMALATHMREIDFSSRLLPKLRYRFTLRWIIYRATP